MTQYQFTLFAPIPAWWELDLAPAASGEWRKIRDESAAFAELLLKSLGAELHNYSGAFQGQYYLTDLDIDLDESALITAAVIFSRTYPHVGLEICRLDSDGTQRYLLSKGEWMEKDLSGVLNRRETFPPPVFYTPEEG